MLCIVKQASILDVRREASSCYLLKRYQRIAAPLQSIPKTEDVCTISDRCSPDSRCATMPTSKSVLQQIHTIALMSCLAQARRMHLFEYKACNQRLFCYGADDHSSCTCLVEYNSAVFNAANYLFESCICTESLQS